MKTQEQWNAVEQEIEELVSLRKIISTRIHNLKVQLNQHKKKYENSNAGVNSFAFEMFGKRLKDLSAEEYRQYYNTRQRINRKNRKQGIKQRPASLRSAKTFAEQIFGKKYNDLSPDEIKVYNRLAQKKHREAQNDFND